MSHRKVNAKTCWECGAEMERCFALMRKEDGVIEYICRRCWKLLDYDGFVDRPQTHEGALR